MLTLVSQAAPHLAVSRLSSTPQFDGVVQLSFALNLWAPSQPRLPLAQLAGEQMQIAVAAHREKLQPIPPATPDRAPLWYFGDTHVRHAQGNGGDLTLWLDARAENGLPVAQAAAISLPSGLRPVDVHVYQDEYRLALDLKVAVRTGRTYTFTKFVASSRQGWGGDSRSDLALVRSARQAGFAALLDAHRQAWARLWQAAVVIEGDPVAQRLVHSDLYYLLANSTADTAWPIGACGMTPNYLGHVFCDADTWVVPALLLLHPQRAGSLVMFRDRTLPVAEQRARARGGQGAMYPWEADPQNGTEQIPWFAHVLSEREIHVNADIAIAQWQYYLATGDRAWLKQDGWPVIRAIAGFWTHRASFNAATGRYDINHVTSVDEPYNDVDNDTFTNVAAAKALRIASAAAAVVGEPADPHWAKVAAGLTVPFSSTGQHHLVFDPAATRPPGSDSTLLLLFLPSLDLVMPAAARRNDYRLATAPILAAGHPPNSMGLAPLSIAAATLGEGAAASRWLQQNLDSKVIKPPFNVRTETASNNTGYFLTAAGGLLQSLLYGLPGLRIEQDGLIAAYPPVLPPGWTRMTLRHVQFRGQIYDITLRRDAAGKITLTRTAAAAVSPVAG